MTSPICFKCKEPINRTRWLLGFIPLQQDYIIHNGCCMEAFINDSDQTIYTDFICDNCRRQVVQCSYCKADPLKWAMMISPTELSRIKDKSKQSLYFNTIYYLQRRIKLMTPHNWSGLMQSRITEAQTLLDNLTKARSEAETLLNEGKQNHDLIIKTATKILYCYGRKGWEIFR